MIEVKGYRCTHCHAGGRVRRTYATPQSCAKHERHCYMNPTNLACATCALWAFDHDERHACKAGHDRGPTAQGTPTPIMGCGFWKLKPKDTP